MITETHSPDTHSPENNEFAELDFAAMLDQYDYDMPERGQILEGVVLEVGQDEILIDVGLKRDAIVTRKDLSLLSEQVKEKIVLGMTIPVYVLQPRNQDGDLIVSINKALELEDWQEIQRAQDADDVLEAEVVDANKGGVMVRLNRLIGFVPQSHLVSLPRFASQHELQEAKKHLFGQSLSLKVLEVDRQRNRLILSERTAQADAQQARMSQLEVGQVVKGRVVSIVNFGAFVDLGGVDGLIHISKLSHSHVNHPGEVLSVGDEVEVLIDSLEPGNNRISLDRAALLPDPWANVAEEYSVDELVECTVTNVVDFGVFAQLPNGLQGLVHISEMTMFGTQNPHDVLREGDVILARIISIEPDNHRMALSIDRVTVDEQEAWMHERTEQNRATGDEIQGRYISAGAEAEYDDDLAEYDAEPDVEAEADYTDEASVDEAAVGEDGVDETATDEDSADDDNSAEVVEDGAVDTEEVV